VELRWPEPVTFDRFVVQEQIALGQRVEGWTLEAWRDGAWVPLAAGTTIGFKRIARFPPVSAERVRFTVTKARACPTISTLALYRSPAR
jgi:alpha-L-fucosidase